MKMNLFFKSEISIQEKQFPFKRNEMSIFLSKKTTKYFIINFLKIRIIFFENYYFMYKT